MNKDEFTELAKALYEPMKQLEHIAMELGLKKPMSILFYPGMSIEALSKEWKLEYDILRDKWTSERELPKEFFLAIDDDLPYERR